jgi:methionyl aminopeptidase
MGLPEVKSKRELELMRVAGKIVAEGLDLAAGQVAPGVTTGELDRVVADFVKKRGGLLAFKNYRGFPGNTCISVNEEVVHGIPGNRKLRGGDIVTIDLGVKYKNYYGDSARTFPVGAISALAKRLLDACRGALEAAIDAVRPGGRLRDVCAAIQGHVEEKKFSVVEKYVGHGIGRRLHEDPQIPNFVTPSYDMDIVLRPGMTLAIEPMVNEGTGDTRELGNRWTVVTADGKLSAHFEHTVLVTENGAEILTAI